MFQEALKAAREYTLPVVLSYRRKDGTTDSSIGSFVVLNEDGWILTAEHIVRQIHEVAEEQKLFQAYRDGIDRINSDETKTKVQKRQEVAALAVPPRNPITNFSSWWGRDEWLVNKVRTNKLADLAVGKIEGFDKSRVAKYPQFKNPGIDFDVGENLCKLGFPFHKIKPIFHEDRGVFELPPEAFPIPLFPIEGIFTRTVVVDNGPESAEYVETSSPGLRGQSGGPTFDARGRIWAIQSRTVHHPLGFSPEAPNQRNREHQFLNSGMGTHANSVLNFLNECGVNVDVSTD